MTAAALGNASDRRLGDALRASRQGAGMSLRDLALHVHVSASALCEIENGRAAPMDVAAGVIRATRDYSLAAEVCRRCPIPRVLKVPRLSAERVDLHAMTIHIKAGEELREALDAHQEVTPHLVNKRRREDFSPADIEAIRTYAKESMQAVVAVEHSILSLALLAGLDPEEMLRDLYGDLRRKGYLD